MTDLHDALNARAGRGSARGAAAVFDRATTAQPSPIDRPRRIAAVLAVAIVLALVAAAVVAARQDREPDDGPIDGPEPTVEVSERVVDPPLFGGETDTTLVLSGGTSGVVALDLDAGTAQQRTSVVPKGNSNSDYPDIGVVGDQLVFANEQGLWSAPADGSNAATLLTSAPNQREVGWNDIFRTFPSGSSGRFWVESGPIGDRLDREFLAAEYDLEGNLTSPPLALGRSDRELVGATSDAVLVTRRTLGSEVEVRDRVSGTVERLLPGGVVVDGDLVLWQEDGELQLLDTSTGDQRAVELPEGVEAGPAGQVSPDGRRLAVTVRSGAGSVLGALDLETGELLAPETPSYDTGWTQPVWSSDGRWLIAAIGQPNDASFLAYRVGADRASTVTVEGLSTWSVAAVPTSGPTPTGAEPCAGVITEEPCLVSAYGDSRSTSNPSADDPRLDRSEISVLVANGSGVADVAARTSEQLAEAGFDVLPPTNTIVDPAETPLDTVYFSSSPDRRRQALGVAEALGLPEAAVLRYPGVDEAPANIGLAEVLVVPGSAPGQLASELQRLEPTTERLGPSVTARPWTGLADGDVVTVSGEAPSDAASVTVVQCAAGDQGVGLECDQSTSAEVPATDRRFEGPFTVSVILETGAGAVDCRVTTCAIFIDSDSGELQVPGILEFG